MLHKICSIKDDDSTNKHLNNSWHLHNKAPSLAPETPKGPSVTFGDVMCQRHLSCHRIHQRLITRVGASNAQAHNYVDSFNVIFLLFLISHMGRITKSKTWWWHHLARLLHRRKVLTLTYSKQTTKIQWPNISSRFQNLRVIHLTQNPQHKPMEGRTFQLVHQSISAHNLQNDDMYKRRLAYNVTSTIRVRHSVSSALPRNSR